MRSSSSRIVVDFPAPFGPRNPNTSPRWTSRSSSNRPRPPPKSFDSPRAAIAGVSLIGPAIVSRRETRLRAGEMAFSTLAGCPTT